MIESSDDAFAIKVTNYTKVCARLADTIGDSVKGSASLSDHIGDFLNWLF